MMLEQTSLSPDSRIHILIVDDHPGTAKTLALALSGMGKGIEVISATSGYEALKLISGIKVDILITDLMMPGMSGLELCEKLQSHPGGHPNYIFLVTAYDVPGLQETAKRLKINEIIIKPFGPELLVNIVEDVLARYETLNAALVVQELADEFEPRADAKNQSLTLVITKSESMIRVNALRIRQALRNLIGNAIKYTPEGGVITLALEHEAGLVQIKVKDTGYGIQAQDLTHIFDRFYRVRNKGQDDIDDNDLGLAIVKSIAEKYGGNLTVESEVNRGTCFTMVLPLLRQISPSLVVKDEMPQAVNQ